MRTSALPVAAALVVSSLLSASALHAQGDLRLNQIQVIGTHNSYNKGFAPSEATWLQQRDPKSYAGLEYAHGSLASQLDGGARQLEIDIAADPEGGRYAHPRIVDLVKQAGLPPDPDFDPNGDMQKPGLKVIHVMDINERSNCPLFTECLKQVKAWSQAHPQHIPIFLLIENKSGGTKNIPNGAVAPKFTAADFDELDREIRTVFSPNEMIVPDQVRGSYPTLEAAVLAGNWPTLASARGKVIFLMDQRSAEPIYTEGHPSLRGRVLFTNAAPGQPDAAFVEQNDAPSAEIDALVKKGYIVRARADKETTAARANDTTRRDELLRSGAQFISTDYPKEEPAKWPGHYFVQLPGGAVARCNPVSAPASCTKVDLETR